ncbi:MAG: flagellar motor protein MotB [Alphaproteobacteria bacterium]|nr:flagellar motor protein MotB [Alphaproteobacteria bacterium]NCQ66159.1 flagellar motor protein MotB [Alphaproteobacteria bacterium]NCT06507.1 flagellar motor protein MotB [Alphaproteobacteria bacterium]
MAEEPRPIIKKIKKVDGHGHHGGAWKVAYADFVTAMMAFFLMMWLLSSTSEEQRRGISNYFGPPGNLTGAGGSGGVLSGLTLSSEGVLEDNVTKGEGQTDGQSNGKKGAVQVPENAEQDDEQVKKALVQELDESLLSSETSKPDLSMQDKEFEKLEKENFKEVEESLKQAIQEDPELKELAKNLIIDETPEGLRIQIVDRDKTSMFKIGEAEPLPHTVKLFKLVARIVKKLPNKISITGHTDAKPYHNRKDYSNWELSSDRSNSARRYLLNFGLNTGRIIFVKGSAATDPLIKDDPFSDQNRRISILLHHMDRHKKPASK